MLSKCFDDIAVYPTQAALMPPFMLFRGGPAWPRFWFQSKVRHCRFRLSLPLDHRPRRRHEPIAASEAEGIWCGPVAAHFGHAIADFGGRLAWSSQFRPDIPLIFSMAPDTIDPPPFFFPMLAHFGIAPTRVRLIREPTMFGRLHVFQQAERLFGGKPTPDYLALLDRIVAAPPTASDGSRLFVSRAGLQKGRFVGEAYLESVLEQAGYEPFRPEMFSLADQMARYRRADHILFSEGSAVHALQLLGSVNARISVLQRRPGHHIAEAALRARARSVDYIDSLAGLVFGARPNGAPQRSSGISVIDERRCVARLAKAGIDIGAHWDEAAYVAHRDQDIRDWIKYRRQRPRPRTENSFIWMTLAKIGISLVG